MTAAPAPMPNPDADASQLAPANRVSREMRNEKPEAAFSRETRNEKRETALAPFLVEQRPEKYTAESHAVWKLLFARRMEHLKTVGSRAFLNGIRAIGLTENGVPDLAAMNRRLEPITGWRAIAVSGFLEPRLFFQCLAERRFPTTVIVRPMAQLDYLPEPDIFHDVFGHVPMHADPVFADFLQRFGAIAATARNSAEVRMLTRLFWFTVEFGLIRESAAGTRNAGPSPELSSRAEVAAATGVEGPGFSGNDGANPPASPPLETRNSKLETGIKVYGSGLISSMADCRNALGSNCERKPFVLDDVLTQEFEIDHLQPVLFVIESHQQLFDAVEQVRVRMSRGLLASDSGGSGPIRLCGHQHEPACMQDLP